MQPRPMAETERFFPKVREVIGATWIAQEACQLMESMKVKKYSKESGMLLARVAGAEVRGGLGHGSAKFKRNYGLSNRRTNGD